MTLQKEPDTVIDTSHRRIPVHHWRNFGRAIVASGALLLLQPASLAGGWGPLSGAVNPTNDITHAQIAMVAAAATALGMNAPAVTGTGEEGDTLVGGVKAYVFGSPNRPNTKYDGFYNPDGDGGIAFNRGDWHPSQFLGGALGVDVNIAVKWASTAYHELAHHTFAVHYKEWCDENPADCAAYEACFSAQGPSESSEKDNPCDEAFANGTAVAKLCADIAAICNSDLSPEHKTERTEAIKKEVDDQVKDCQSATNSCNACPTHPPMPDGFGGCGPSSGCDSC